MLSRNEDGANHNVTEVVQQKNQKEVSKKKEWTMK